MNKFLKFLCASSLLLLAACQGKDAYYHDEDSDQLYSKGKYQDMENKVSDVVYFAFDSDALSEEAKAVLSRQAKLMTNNPDSHYIIEGHTDERGTAEYNLALGERRAEAVKRFLMKEGVSKNQVDTVSFGKEKPAVIGNTEKDYQQNRRAVTVKR